MSSYHCPCCGGFHEERFGDDRFTRERDELIKALEKAVETIRIFNGLGMPKNIEPDIWNVYQSSPEMKQINAALKRVRGDNET